MFRLHIWCSAVSKCARKYGVDYRESVCSQVSQNGTVNVTIMLGGKSTTIGRLLADLLTHGTKVA